MPCRHHKSSEACIAAPGGDYKVSQWDGARAQAMASLLKVNGTLAAVETDLTLAEGQ